MMAGYAAASRKPSAPAPTIESLLHHALPFRSVLHTHADAIVALTDTVHGPELAAQVLGDDVIVVPYVMPGFELAVTASAAWQARRADRCTAIVLAHHGLFTMGDEVAEAYDRHLELVRRAEEFLAREAGWRADPFDGADGVGADVPRELRAALDAVAPASPAVAVCTDDEVRAFVTRADLPVVAQRGPTTLEHVIRTKRVPMLGRDVDAYVEDYTRYFERNAPRSPGVRMLDPTPRVILDPDLGLVTTGPDPATAQAVLDIYRHTIRIIAAAERLGGYRTMTEAQAFDIEYWELEQRRLRPGGVAGE
jgi:rhamnose utilization protein RhaD (predicted bifunctional aldolase and dehydrogenase)